MFTRRNDDLNAARGIINALLISAIFWGILFAIFA